MSDEITITKENFEEEVIQSTIPALVDFWAEWCGPCRMLAPVIEELAKEYRDQAKVCKVNVDQNPEIAEKYGIRGIPTIILFKNGAVAEQMVGVQSKETLKGMISKHIS